MFGDIKTNPLTSKVLEKIDNNPKNCIYPIEEELCEGYEGRDICTII